MKPPIFIIGNPRSGTSLLRLMLTCHRNIVIPPECGFAVWLYNAYGDWGSSGSNHELERFLDALMACRKIETWNLDKTCLLTFMRQKNPASYAEAVSLVYEYYALSQRSAFKRWGDKNNWYLEHILTIKAIFPNVHFVHIVRDGRDVACSYRKLGNSVVDSPYAPRLPERVEDIAWQWRNNIERVRSSFASLAWQGVFEVRYEDLVRDPSASLAKLCQQIDEPYDPSMLDYYIINRKRQLEPKEFLQWKARTLEPPTASTVGEYLSQMKKDEILLFEHIAAKQLRQYGYL